MINLESKTAAEGLSAYDVPTVTKCLIKLFLNKNAHCIQIRQIKKGNTFSISDNDLSSVIFVTNKVFSRMFNI